MAGRPERNIFITTLSPPGFVIVANDWSETAMVMEAAAPAGTCDLLPVQYQQAKAPRVAAETTIVMNRRRMFKRPNQLTDGGTSLTFKLESGGAGPLLGAALWLAAP